MKSTDHLPRRSFLKTIGLAVPLALGGSAIAFGEGQTRSHSRSSAKKVPTRELAADLVIVGGGLGGCAPVFCLAKKRLPREVRKKGGWLRKFQGLLAENGAPRAWPG